MIYVTTGEQFTDIDAFASAVAYSKLLSKKGSENKVYLPGKLNFSITGNIRSWDINFETKISSNPNDKFVVVDISELSHIAKLATKESIIELFDHRYGFEDTWKDLLGKKAKIEKVGSCATLIWEEYRNSKIQIDDISANLLIIAIVSNTLDFKSSVTDKRDVFAFRELQQFITLPEDWKKNYFEEQTQDIIKNTEKAVKEDTKIILDDIVFGQVEIWNGKNFIKNNLSDAKRALVSFNFPDWMLSVPSIGEGVNYIYTESSRLKNLLSKILDIKFESNLGKTNKLWLRKEIREKMLKLEI